ncbi:MAG: hypothetical protein CM15mP84_05810 [Cellvibrionales bacterium]|nr:MAG: hypothetical protein CM15mP84_05810 [Cellvibrionales bacterium]
MERFIQIYLWAVPVGAEYEINQQTYFTPLFFGLPPGPGSRWQMALTNSEREIMVSFGQ